MMGSRLCIKCGRLNDDAGYNYCTSCFAEVSEKPRMPSAQWDRAYNYNPENELKERKCGMNMVIKEINVHLGTWLRNKMQEHNMTQNQAAEAVGMKAKTFSNTLYGTRFATPEEFERLQAVFGEYPYQNEINRPLKRIRKKAEVIPKEEEVKIPESVDELAAVIEQDLAEIENDTTASETEPAHEEPETADDDIFETKELYPEGFIKPYKDEMVTVSVEMLDDLKMQIELLTATKNNYSDAVRALTEKNEALEHKIQELSDETKCMAREIVLLERSNQTESKRRFNIVDAVGNNIADNMELEAALSLVAGHALRYPHRAIMMLEVGNDGKE